MKKKITIQLGVILTKRKMTLTRLSQIVGISIVNLSILKSGKAKGIRFETLRKICEAIDCKPGDILDIE